jgi:hypothetical protein
MQSDLVTALIILTSDHFKDSSIRVVKSSSLQVFIEHLPPRPQGTI